jgi:hypothetical protein
MDEEIPPINLEEVAERDFKYYIFDWDDNILHMPTKIHLERRQPDGSWELTKVSTSTFALIRNDTENYRPPGNNWENSFQEFRDLEGSTENSFLAHTRDALAPIISGEEDGAPSFHRFKDAVIEGRLFAIVTARGHAPETICKGVEYFIEYVLSEEERQTMLSNLRGYMAYFNEYEYPMSHEEVLANYLRINRFYGVTSPSFLQRLEHSSEEETSGAENPEIAKQLAIKDFVGHVLKIIHTSGIEKPISFGFSDDDPRNVSAVEDYIHRRLAHEFPGVKFVVYDTSDPEVPKGRKVVVQGQLELGL